MGVAGSGSCVGGTAFPEVGGCRAAAPATSPPTSPPSERLPAVPAQLLLHPPEHTQHLLLGPVFPRRSAPSAFLRDTNSPATPASPRRSTPSASRTGTPLPASRFPALPPPIGCPAPAAPARRAPGGNNGGGGGNNGGSGGNGTGQSQAGAVAGTTATSTPFTGGPPHPFPTVGIAIVGLGLLISGFTFWPGARRRLHLRLERTKNNW